MPFLELPRLIARRKTLHHRRNDVVRKPLTRSSRATPASARKVSEVRPAEGRDWQAVLNHSRARASKAGGSLPAWGDPLTEASISAFVPIASAARRCRSAAAGNHGIGGEFRAAPCSRAAGTVDGQRPAGRYIGCSDQSVPSLSNTAIASAGGTYPSPPFLVDGCRNEAEQTLPGGAPRARRAAAAARSPPLPAAPTPGGSRGGTHGANPGPALTKARGRQPTGERFPWPSGWAEREQKTSPFWQQRLKGPARWAQPPLLTGLHSARRSGPRPEPGQWFRSRKPPGPPRVAPGNQSLT